MKTFLSLVLLLTFACVTGLAETRTWTNTSGKTLEGEYVRSDSKEVRLKLKNGSTPVIKIESLSQEDQDFIKKCEEEAKAKNAEADAKKAAEQKSKISFKWGKKMEIALKDATEYDLPIIVLFTGASWCGYCVKLEEEVLSLPEFKKLASGKMLGVKYECPSPGDYSSEGKKKAKEYKITGVPHYIILDKDGKVLGRGGYHKGMTPKELVDKVTNSGS